MRNKAIDAMLEAIRQAVSRCTASERDTFEALVVEAEGWKMRLEELEAEDE